MRLPMSMLSTDSSVPSKTPWRSKNWQASWQMGRNGSLSAENGVPYWVWVWAADTTSGRASWMGACIA